MRRPIPDSLRMNVRIPTYLWTELKQEGKRRRMSLGEIVAEYIKKAKAMELQTEV